MRPLGHARELHQEAVRLLKRHLRSGAPEDLHQFRVRLKRLKALFYLTDRPRRAWTPYREIFRCSSALRDADVAAASGLTGGPPPDGAAFRRRARAFTRAYPALPGPSEEQIRPLRLGAAAASVAAGLDELSALLGRPPPCAAWHGMRKTGKRILHNHRLLKKALLPAPLRRALEEMDDRIGAWHDRMAAGDGPGAARRRAAVRRAMAAVRTELTSSSSAARSPPD